jgi:hypothetical protein
LFFVVEKNLAREGKVLLLGGVNLQQKRPPLTVR